MKCIEVISESHRVTGEMKLHDLSALRITRGSDDGSIMSKLREEKPQCSFEFCLLQVRDA